MEFLKLAVVTGSASANFNEFIIPEFGGIHGYSIAAAAVERPVPPRPTEFSNYADRARQPDRRADCMLGGLGACDLPGASAPGRRRGRFRRLLRRLAVGGLGRLRADYLPDGSRGD